MFKQLILATAVVAAGVALAAAKTLDIYFIDVEGGQSTLIVTPGRQSLLVDTGFAATSFADTTTNRGRDAKRILAAARDAGVSRIDYLLTTHFHADHDGGVVEFVKQLPIATFVDHGTPDENVDSVPGSTEQFQAYARIRAKGKHLEPKPGDKIPLKGVDVTVVSAKRDVIAHPLPGATGANSACGAALPAQEKN